MPVRAKFTCTSVRKYQSSFWDSEKQKPRFLYEYEFSAVTDQKGGEDASFFQATPSGSLKLSAVKDDLFVPGNSYYLDFSEAA